MANISIGPSKRNFIIIIIPEFAFRIVRLSLKVTITANTIAQDGTIFYTFNRRMLTAREIGW
ncbi:hypothetical protein E4K08_22030 [Raoultella ornithinolytica]|jgi:hypothetical protein|nr:hypothetical protein AN237_12030 [Raoultella ornithinolytica]AXC31496.1 hypothetical protein DSD31_19480 [Raoultella sp. X13]ASI57244.1 hypothetical protein CA210_02840 [Raoultella ornithinolytica]KAB8150762.1 hypothetical protein FNV34_01340 [Raoultella ornithinolytica]KAB8158145.1 hypothetical protein FNV36_13000 [Raoultella ornithinolytica]